MQGLSRRSMLVGLRAALALVAVPVLPRSARAAIGAEPSASGTSTVYTGWSHSPPLAAPVGHANSTSSLNPVGANGTFVGPGASPGGRRRRRALARWELRVIQPDGRRLVVRGHREPSHEPRVLQFRVDPDP